MAVAIRRVLRFPYPCRPTANSLTEGVWSYGGADTASLRPIALSHIQPRSARRPLAVAMLSPRRAMRRIILQRYREPDSLDQPPRPDPARMRHRKLLRARAR